MIMRVEAKLIYFVASVASIFFIGNVFGYEFTLKDIRQTYPVYNDISDSKLLSLLYEKYGKCDNKQLFYDKVLNRPPQTDKAKQALKNEQEAIKKRAECSMKAIKDINTSAEAAVNLIQINCGILNPMPCEESGDPLVNVDFDENGKLKK